MTDVRLCISAIDERVLADEGTDIDAVDQDGDAGGPKGTETDNKGKVLFWEKKVQNMSNAVLYFRLTPRFLFSPRRLRWSKSGSFCLHSTQMETTNR